MSRSHQFPSMPDHFFAWCCACSSVSVKPVVVVGPHLSTRSSRNWSQSIHLPMWILCHHWNFMIVGWVWCVWLLPEHDNAEWNLLTVVTFTNPDLMPFETDSSFFWLIRLLFTSKQYSWFFLYICLHVNMSSLTCLLWSYDNILQLLHPQNTALTLLLW